MNKIQLPGFFLFLCFFLTWVQDGGAQEVGGDQDREAVVGVTVRPLATLVTYPREEAPAEVLSLNDATVSAELSGVIQAFHVEVGDLVEKGAVIAHLADWLYQHQVRQAQGQWEELSSRLNLARSELKRVTRLKATDHSSESLLESRQADVEQRKAQLASQQSRRQESQDRLNKTRVTAPFAGVIAERPGQVGQWVGPGTPLVRLVDLKQVELSARLAPHRVPLLKKAEQLRFEQGTQSYPVRFHRWVAVADPVTRTVEVRLHFVDRLPPPGTAGRLTWQDPDPHLPPWVLVRREQGLGLFFARAGKAFFYPLPEAREGMPTRLPPGIAPGIAPESEEEVVIEGREALQHGTPVQILPLAD